MGKYYNKVLRSKVISSGFSFCKTCSQTKPIDRFYYKYGSLYKCKQCISKKLYEYRILRGQKTLEERQAERERKTIEFNQRIETEIKICPSCGENKVLTKFGVHRKTKSITSICSVCRHEKSKKSYPHLYSFEYRKTKYIKHRKKKNSAYVYKAQQIEQEQILQKGYMFCTQCKVEKPLERFEKKCRGNGFYYRACRECRNQKSTTAKILLTYLIRML